VDVILQADGVRVGAPTLVDMGMVLGGRRGTPTFRELDELVRELGVTVVAFGEAEWRAAWPAYGGSGAGGTRPR